MDQTQIATAQTAKSTDRIYHEYYTQWYRTDSTSVAATSAFYDRLLGPHLPTNRFAKILDVGCGLGLALKALREKGYTNVAGIDVNTEQARIAAELVGTVEHVADSTEWLTRHAGVFDFIFSTDVVEHVERPDQIAFVRAICKALGPGGVFLCTVPNANSAISTRWRYLDFTHHASFTEHSLAFLMRAAGFEDVRITESDIFRISGGRRQRFKILMSDALRVMVRAAHRAVMIAELGIDEGSEVPLSVNLMGIGRRP